MLGTIGLFAGIGGIEEGLRRAGHRTELLCEIDGVASDVLRRHFPDARLVADICDLSKLPSVDLVTAGFPCQDLSQAGRTRGIRGRDSGLVREVFRLLGRRGSAPTWLLLENVPFMLQLDRGRAMTYIVRELESLGYAWAYRVVDTRAFGLPQRRRRVLMLASKTEDPRPVLLAEDAPRLAPDARSASVPCGFYWTEGNTGLGWVINGIPALKAGSRVSIPSPPAIWFPRQRSLVLPNIRDAERLQGFPSGWTTSGAEAPRACERNRWRLVGNAVSVPLAEWLGRQLERPHDRDPARDRKTHEKEAWGNAGWGAKGQRYGTDVSEWPVRHGYKALADFLRFAPTPLSARATAGFYARARASRLRYPHGFLEDVAHHLKAVSDYAV